MEDVDYEMTMTPCSQSLSPGHGSANSGSRRAKTKGSRNTGASPSANTDKLSSRVIAAPDATASSRAPAPSIGLLWTEFVVPAYIFGRVLDRLLEQFSAGRKTPPINHPRAALACG